MNKNIESLYPEIGEMLLDLIPENFQQAWIRVEMIEDVWSSGIFFTEPNGRVRYLNKNLEEMNRRFRQLRSLFVVAGNPPFTTATYHLRPNGKFTIDYGYDDVSDFSLAPQRRENWIKKYIGENTKIDWK
jgi:hypothetical protein